MKPQYTKPFVTLLTPAQHAALQDAAKSTEGSMGDVMRDALEAWLQRIGPVASVPAETIEAEVERLR